MIIPQENEKDLVEIPKNIKDKLEIVPVRWIDEVLEIALQHMPVPQPLMRLSKGQAEAAGGIGEDEGRPPALEPV